MSETVTSAPPRPTRLTLKGPVMAAIVGMTERRLQQLAKEGMPREGRDGYPLASCVQWIIDYWRKRATQTPLGDARRRIAEAEAAQAEISLAKAREEVAPIATLAKSHGEACARVRTRLLALPSKIAPNVFGMKTIREVEAVIRREIIEALEELSVGSQAKH